MTQLESVCFDLVRIVAATVVLIGHMVILMPGALPVSDFGHHAVVAFFVLSGYVIAFVADTKEKTGREYTISRIARLYSVALPAIFLTVICDLIGHNAAASAIYANIPSDWPLVRIGAALSFSSELWFISITPFSNGPYWSLCYEASYYAIFAAAVYLKGGRRAACVAALCLLVGPKILAMFPIWLLGVALYRYGRNVGPWFGTLFLLGSMAALAAYLQSGATDIIAKFMNEILGQKAYRLMEYSNNFPADYITGLFIAAGLIGIRGLAATVSVPAWAASAIRYFAGSTFSLYLFHRPILIMLIAPIAAKIDTTSAILIGICTALIAFALSHLTERRKRFWRSVADKLLRGKLTVA